MSKVIRDSIGFVPEKIVATEDDQSAVWQDLAAPFRVEHPAAQTGQPATSAPKEELQDRQTETAEEHTQSSFDDDFSSPDPEHQHEEETDEAQQEAEPEPQINVEALAEEYFNKGVQAGVERMETDYKLAIRTLQSICEELDTVRETILQNSLKEMQELVLVVAEKIIRHSVASQDETVTKTVEEAILQAVKSDEFIISVNPQDYDSIKSRSSDFINAVNGLENIIVKSDPSVEQGGCLVESSNCTVDATLSSQLEIISEAVKNQ